MEESRPRLRSRRDGRMSAAGRLAEQAAEAAAAAGRAADGTLLVVRARATASEMQCGPQRLLVVASFQVAALLAFITCDTCCLARSQADGRGAAFSLPEPRTDASTDSAVLAAPAVAQSETAAAEGSRQETAMGDLISTSTSAATSRIAGAAIRPVPLDGDSSSASRLRGAGPEVQFAAQPGKATTTGQQGSRRAGSGLQMRQSLPQARADASTTWQAELASALRAARVKTTSKIAQDERRLTQAALALLPTAVSDNADE